MANYPDHLRYSKEHEWIRLEGKQVVIGITEYAVEQLGDIVHVELPETGAVCNRDDALGVVESVKSVSDVFAPVSLKVTEVNDALLANPGVIGQDPYGQGWIVRAELSEPAQIDALLSAEGYESFLSDEA